MKRLVFFAPAVFMTVFFCFSCGPEKPKKPVQKLNVYEIMGSTPEDLIERLGKPVQFNKHKLVRWKNVDGVRVFVALEKGKASYISYQFEEMKRFNEAKAFEIIGLEQPEEEGKKIGDSVAKRWSPFGAYDKLTVMPRTKSITIGKDPVRKTVPWDEIPVAARPAWAKDK